MNSWWIMLLVLCEFHCENICDSVFILLSFHDFFRWKLTSCNVNLTVLWFVNITNLLGWISKTALEMLSQELIFLFQMLNLVKSMRELWKHTVLIWKKNHWNKKHLVMEYRRNVLRIAIRNCRRLNQTIPLLIRICAVEQWNPWENFVLTNVITVKRLFQKNLLSMKRLLWRGKLFQFWLQIFHLLKLMFPAGQSKLLCVSYWKLLCLILSDFFCSVDVCFECSMEVVHLFLALVCGHQETIWDFQIIRKFHCRLWFVQWNREIFDRIFCWETSLWQKDCSKKFIFDEDACVEERNISVSTANVPSSDIHVLCLWIKACFRQLLEGFLFDCQCFLSWHLFWMSHVRLNVQSFFGVSFFLTRFSDSYVLFFSLGCLCWMFLFQNRIFCVSGLLCAILLLIHFLL